VRILLTGATGSFGRNLCREFCDRGCDLVLLLRAADDGPAERRTQAIVGDLPRATVVRGDVTRPGLGLTGRAQHLLGTVDAVVHAAATTEFGLPLEASRRVNVDGTRNVLDVAARMPRLCGFAYVGTAFVAGRRTGRILETELAHEAGFVTTYEQSKYEAELVVRASDLPASVFRPSVVVERRDEPRPRPSGLRFTIELIRAGLLPVLPCPPDACLDLVGAEKAARTIAALFLSQDTPGTFHVAAGPSAQSVDAIVAAAEAPPVRHVALSAFEAELETLRLAHPHARRAYDVLATFLGMLAYPKLFDTTLAQGRLRGPVSGADPLLELRPLARHAARVAA
jgi:nucleoside-diphosphate-sugar epimerase